MKKLQNEPATGRSIEVELTAEEKAQFKRDRRNSQARAAAKAADRARVFLTPVTIIDRLTDDDLGDFQALHIGPPDQRRFAARFYVCPQIDATDPAVVALFELLFGARASEILAPE